LNETAITVSAGIFNLVQDFMVATLPIFAVWDLQIPLSKKAGVITIFALGYM
jgi:hypothetical protein